MQKRIGTVPLMISQGLLQLALYACNDSGTSKNGSQELDCNNDVIPVFSAIAAFSVCTGCHSSERTGPQRSNAPNGIDFDTYESARANARDALAQVNAGAMPPEGAPELTENELASLKRWLTCGTPE